MPPGVSCTTIDYMLGTTSSQPLKGKIEAQKAYNFPKSGLWLQLKQLSTKVT